MRQCRSVVSVTGVLTTHSLQELKFNLIRMCASMIYSHWAGSMPPEQTDLGAVHSDRAISAAVAALVV